MRLLELFKGTGSWGKAFKELHEDATIISLDILQKYNPTHCSDIMDFDYKQYPVGYFTHITASPECKVYSPLAHTNVGANRHYKTKEDLLNTQEEHSKYIKRVLDIIDYFKPTYYFIENPYASAIKKYIPDDMSFYRFDYCRFGFDYMKPTKIWTNKELESRKCKCKGKHSATIGWSTNQPKGRNRTDINERYSIPQNLIKYLFT